VPPSASAKVSAAADLPLAVGPATMTIFVSTVLRDPRPLPSPSRVGGDARALIQL
jgi:hypothetical protein